MKSFETHDLSRQHRILERRFFSRYHSPLLLNQVRFLYLLPPGGGYFLVMGMCLWMGLHFHGWTDYNGVAFSLELLEWDRTFSGFGESENSGRQEFKNGTIFTSLMCQFVSG